MDYGGLNALPNVSQAGPLFENILEQKNKITQLKQSIGKTSGVK